MSEGKETRSTTEKTQEYVLNQVLEDLFYDDMSAKKVNSRTLKLITVSKHRIGEANAIFIEGILQYNLGDESFKIFLEAEQKGCRHPLLYYYLANCCSDMDDDRAQNTLKALEYSNLAIRGNCGIGVSYCMNRL